MLITKLGCQEQKSTLTNRRNGNAIVHYPSKHNYTHQERKYLCQPQNFKVSPRIDPTSATHTLVFCSSLDNSKSQHTRKKHCTFQFAKYLDFRDYFPFKPRRPPKMNKKILPDKNKYTSSNNSFRLD